MLSQILDPFFISMFLFVLVSINMLVEVNDRLRTLGAANDGVSRGRLLWFYFSAVYSYLLRCLIALFTIFILITVIIVIIIGIFHLMKGVKDFINKGESREEVMKKAMGALFATISKYVKGNIDYVYKFVMTSKVLGAFLVALPLFMLIFMIGYACTYYQPISTVPPDVPESELPVGYMNTNHQFLFYLLSMFIFGMIFYVIYEFYVLGDH